MAMTMRERIARAILNDLGDRKGILSDVDEDVKTEIGDTIADAVLAELETPTDGMVEAAALTIIDNPDEIHMKLVSAGMSAAIRAAREGK
jgi:hypothetical protein